MLNLLLFSLLFQQPAPIRVTTRMVEVGVLVHDQNGKPVTGLRAPDFKLLDGGREEAIRSFSTLGRERLEATGAHVSTGILLDHFNSFAEDEAFGRNELLRFLRQLEPSHPVALLSLDNGFQVLHDYTLDATSLAQALERYRPWPPLQGKAIRLSPFHGKFSRMPPNAVDMLDRKAAAYYGNLRARESLSSISALAAFLARTPGRKNLIWMSSMFPALLAARVRADDVAVYPIDVTAPPLGPSPEARFLAEHTGGVAFDHKNDLVGGIRQAYQDGAAVYLLGYYPSHGQWDGRFHPIQVAVSRPDAVLRYRTGYVAALDGTFREPDQRETLWYVAASPTEARGIGVAARASRLKDGPVELALAVDAHTLSLGTPGAGGLKDWRWTPRVTASGSCATDSQQPELSRRPRARTNSG